MSKYLKITGIFLGIWFIASLLNGLLSGIAIAVFENGQLYYGSGTVALSLIFSFLFSVPIVGLVWFVAVCALLAEKKGDALFQFILGTAFLCAIAGAVFFITTIGTDFKDARYIAGLCIIISALTAVLFFRKQIKANG
ncbi:MAG: hypothetical protein WBP16_00455 [Ferruginibacter sp.]